MSFAMALKIFADCSLCFAILGMVNAGFSIPLLFPAVLYAVFAGFATFFDTKNRPALRRLCALLPWSCLLFGTTVLQIVLLAAPALYCSLVILFGTLELEYYTYRQFLLRSLLLLGAGCFMAGVWTFVTQAILQGQSALDARALIRYGLVYLLCSIVLQRQLRLGIEEHAEGGRRQMATMLAVTATIILCTVLGEPFLRQGAGFLIGTVLTIAATPLMLLIRLVEWLIERAPDKPKREFLESLNRSNEDKKSPQQFEGIPEQAPEVAPFDITRLGVIVILVILSVVAVVLLVKSFQRQRQKAEPAENIGTVPKLPKKKKEPLLSNRAKVRQAYRSFLRAERDLGMKLHSSDTSADVLGRIHRNTDRAGADDLRNVYLNARYDERHNISRKQVEQAKRALKATRKKA